MAAIATPILITGATGFVGANVLRRLVSDGYEVHAIIRQSSNVWRIKDFVAQVKIEYAEMTDGDSLQKIMNKIKPRTIFHLAAYGAYPHQNEPDKIFQVNVLGTLHLLRACAEVGFDVFINTGSSSEYGRKDKPMREQDVAEPNSWYAVAKTAQTLLCQHQGRDHHLPIRTLRLFSVYGPYEEPARLMPTLMLSCLRGKDLLLVPPQTAHDFIYVDDVVEMYLNAATNARARGEIINVGSGRQTTMREVVDCLLSVSGARVGLRWGAYPSRQFDQENWQADIGAMVNLLHYQPRYDLRQGIANMYQWFVKHVALYAHD